MRYSKFIKLLKQMGYYFVRSGKGTHEIWTNGDKKITITRQKINKMVAKRILKEIGFTRYHEVV